MMKFKKVPLLAYLCLISILLTLGTWQLNRAEEKRELLKLQTQQKSSQILVLSGTMPEAQDKMLFKNVQAIGHYDGNHQYLLDNQVHKGRAGYFVLTPFQLKDSNKAVLVNRGWIAQGKSRADLPNISVDNEEITVAGRINRFPRVGLKLADAEYPSNNWPAVVQVIDSKVLENGLGYHLFGFQVELDKQSANGFTREWQSLTTMTPEKHLAYAVQWFLLAITLTVLFVKYGTNKDND
jgi:surfeit locus 1 family protein